MANVDPELQRLEEAVRVARERVAQVRQSVADPAAIKAAIELCAEAIEDLAAYQAKGT
jgi:prefoldin subunit 5